MKYVLVIHGSPIHFLRVNRIVHRCTTSTHKFDSFPRNVVTASTHFSWHILRLSQRLTTSRCAQAVLLSHISPPPRDHRPPPPHRPTGRTRHWDQCQMAKFQPTLSPSRAKACLWAGPNPLSGTPGSWASGEGVGSNPKVRFGSGNGEAISSSSSSPYLVLLKYLTQWPCQDPQRQAGSSIGTGTRLFMPKFGINSLHASCTSSRKYGAHQASSSM